LSNVYYQELHNYWGIVAYEKTKEMTRWSVNFVNGSCIPPEMQRSEASSGAIKRKDKRDI